MQRVAVSLNGLALMWAVGATLWMLEGAGYGGSVVGVMAGPDAAVGHLGVSLGSAHGPWVVALLVVVTVLSGIPVGVSLTHPAGQRTVGWVAGLLLLAISAMAGFSLGLTYLPVALLILAAAAVAPPAPAGAGGIGMAFGTRPSP